MTENCANNGSLPKYQPRKFADRCGGQDCNLNRFLANATASVRLSRLLALIGRIGGLADRAAGGDPLARQQCTGSNSITIVPAFRLAESATQAKTEATARCV